MSTASKRHITHLTLICDLEKCFNMTLIFDLEQRFSRTRRLIVIVLYLVKFTVNNSLPDHLRDPSVDREQFTRDLKTYQSINQSEFISGTRPI